MKLNSKGQAKLEFATLYIIIFIVLLLMGPYLWRGINAFFKDIDEQTSDSFSDPLMQAEGNIDKANYHLPVVIADE